MPHPTHTRPAALAATLALALAGCSGGHADAAGTRPGPREGSRPGAAALDAPGLRALAATRTATALLPATGTTAQVERALAATLPPATAVTGYDRAAVAGALAFAARLVAATRGDRGYLCGPRAASPISPLGDPAFQAYLADPKTRDNRSAVEVTIGSARRRDDCGPLRWVGPGIVVGKQTWTVGTDGQDLTVRWSGRAGYALADPQGHPEPWNLNGHAGYELVRQGTGWALDTWTADTNTTLNTGWPSDVPVPDGYLPIPATPPGAPAALAAVRGAAARWNTAVASTTSSEAASTIDDHQQGRSVNHVTGTTVAAPARGDAATVYTYDGGRTRSRSLHLDHGRRTLVQVTGKTTAVPGKTVPARPKWISTDDTVASDGTGYTDDPFAVTALIAGADAAAPAACPAGLTAARCYTALVVTRDGGDLRAGQFTGAQHRQGRPYVVVDVGLDDRGRPAFLRVAQTSLALGATLAVLTGTTRFTAYPTAPPPPVTVPDPATVADAADVDF